MLHSGTTSIYWQVDPLQIPNTQSVIQQYAVRINNLIMFLKKIRITTYYFFPAQDLYPHIINRPGVDGAVL